MAGVADPAVRQLDGTPSFPRPEDSLTPEVEAVVIAAPAPDHARLVMMALGAGRHVFVEKPLSLSLDDAERCAEEADRRGLILMTGHLMLYHPAFRRLAHMVADGAIGDLRHITSTRLLPGTVRTGEDALWSLAPHDVSMVLTLSGREPTEVLSRRAFISGRRLADEYTAWLDFSGMTARLDVSWLSPRRDRRLAVYGSRGALVFDDTVSALTLYATAEGSYDFQSATARHIPYLADEPLSVEVSAFLDSIRTGRQPLTGPAEAVPVVRTLSRIEAAAR